MGYSHGQVQQVGWVGFMAFREVTCSEKDIQLCHFAQENPNPVTSLVLFSCPLKVGNRKRAGTRDPPLVS